MNQEKKQLVEELASAVQHGKISRGKIRKQHGNGVYRAVCDEIEARRQASFAAAPAPEEAPEESADNPVCDCCGECLSDVPWDQSSATCELCQAEAAKAAWYESTEQACKELAARFGFSFRQVGGWGKSSWYYELVFVDSEDQGHTVNLRISDHGILYCNNNDISIAMIPAPDDHDISDLERLLKRIAGK